MIKMRERARNVQLLILDVDGILTDGTIYYGNDGAEIRAFNILDGLGLVLLKHANVPTAIISGKKSDALIKRLNELKIEHFYLGNPYKKPAYDALKEAFKLKDEHIAYMGDDIPDLPLLQSVGFAVTVPNATTIIKENVHYITQKEGGRGAVREVCDFIIQAKQLTSSVIESYLAPNYKGETILSTLG